MLLASALDQHEAIAVLVAEDEHGRYTFPSHHIARVDISGPEVHVVGIGVLGGEPNTGLDTTRLRTRAVRDGDHYVMNGEKVWITGAHISDYMMIAARTKPIEDTVKPIDGITLFCTKIDRNHVRISPIKKHGYNSIASNELFITDLNVPAADRIGVMPDLRKILNRVFAVT